MRIHTAALVILGTFVGAGCEGGGGTEERLAILHAERVEIIDPKGAVKMDLEKHARALEERVARLEGELQQLREAGRHGKVVESTAPGDAGAAPALAPPPEASRTPGPRRPKDPFGDPGY